MWLVLEVVPYVVCDVDDVCDAERVQHIFVGCQSLVSDIQTRDDGDRDRRVDGRGRGHG